VTYASRWQPVVDEPTERVNDFETGAGVI
jgi:hypothetical protein